MLSKGHIKRVKAVQASYEDVLKVPASPLLQELDNHDFLFPRNHYIVLGLPEIPAKLLSEPPSLLQELSNEKERTEPQPCHVLHDQTTQIPSSRDVEDLKNIKDFSEQFQKKMSQNLCIQPPFLFSLTKIHEK